MALTDDYPRLHNVLFDTLTYCRTMAAIALAQVSIWSHNCDFFSVLRISQIYSLGHIHMYNTKLLAIITLLYGRFPEFISLLTGSLYTLIDHIWRHYS